MTKIIYDKKFYEVNQLDVPAAKAILSYVLDKIKPKSIVDFGCGSGTWLSVAEELGVKDILGLDGDYVDKSWLLFDKSKFKSVDLRKKLDLNKKFDLAVSLEVAEHIDEKYSSIYLDNLTSASDVILFSAAVPFQGGTNHVNEQFPSYWINRFDKYGYVPYDALRWKYWDDTSIAFWYRQNIMFFVKKDKLEDIKKLFPIGKIQTDMVHPVRMFTITDEHNNEINRLNSEYESKFEENNNKYNLEIENIKLNYNKEIDDINNNHSKELEDINNNHSNEIERLNKEYFEKISKLNAEYGIKIENLEKINEEYKESNAEMKKTIEKNNNYIAKLEDLSQPKVTVVVPVFNVKPFLKECLDSILNQTLKQIEVICGDGGSNDGSLEILREYEKKDIRVKVISRDRSGYGQSVNECMDIAKGEYIGIVESDDKVDPKMYETLYCIAKSNDLDWIRSDIYFYYSGLPKKEQLVKESITYGGDFYNQILDPKYDCRPYRSGLRSWSGIYKKEFLDHYQIRHHETPGGSYQDVGFYLKTLYDARRVYFLDKPFYMWRQDNPGSSIHYDSKKLVEKSVNEWNLNKEYLMNRSDADNRIWGSFNYRRFHSYLWTIEMAQGEDKDGMIKFAINEFNEAMNNNQISKDFFDDGEWNRFLEFIGRK